MKNLVLLIFIALFGCGIQSSQSQNDEKPTKTSIIAIIANPEIFHGKKVTISGYFNLYDRHSKAIYIDKEDYNNGLFKNGLNLLTTEKILKQKYEFDFPYEGYITITGTFNKDKLGFNNFFSGTLENINDIYRIPIKD